jgi:hypothetical protein
MKQVNIRGRAKGSITIDAPLDKIKTNTTKHPFIAGI